MKQTEIYRLGFMGERVKVEQKHIDFWCNACQFPLVGGDHGCEDTEGAIQQCWSESGGSAGRWHKQHECPFIHLEQECHCNDYKTIKDAFKVCGLTYGE